MKIFFKTFLLLLFLSQTCFSQKAIDWNKAMKVELYSFSKNLDCNNVTAKKVNSKTLIKGNTEALLNHIKSLKKYELDVLIENECVVLRVYFPKHYNDFIVYLDQGLLLELKKQNAFNYEIQDKEGFRNLINKLRK